jgi:cyclic pyranopterin phosphate synthase
VLTHIDSQNKPTMVDVSHKKLSIRMASAETLVELPSELKAYFRDGEFYLKKGPVFQTAIIAGTMAVKKTFEIIPFCHQVPIESCKFSIEMVSDVLIKINCKVKTTYKTGIEMEAIHGAMTAALTIYDMCKAVSPNIIIKETKLIAKTGGKRTHLERPTYGLVLTGGKSQRMQTDKALINYKGKPHAEYIYDILENYCDEVFLSARPNQWRDTPLDQYPSLSDAHEDLGPTGGILTALEHAQDVNWIIVACDLVHFNEKTIEKLLANFKEHNSVATCYKNSEKGFPEPLCAIYTPEAKSIFIEAIKNDTLCPVKILKQAQCELIDQEDGIDLSNINTREEYTKVMNENH